MTTLDVLQRHLQAVLAGDLDAVVQDYTEDSVIITAHTTATGLNQIRSFFKGSWRKCRPALCRL
jgi:ketosteroid isomerase-like protein